jgi:RNA polymerase sigma-70 factor (ECF subfamily)
MLPTQDGEETDESLYARVGRGDRAAFARLVGRHRQRLGAVVTRMTGQAAAAEDIVQESFVRAWGRRPAGAAGRTVAPRGSAPGSPASR